MHCAAWQEIISSCLFLWLHMQIRGAQEMNTSDPGQAARSGDKFNK